MSHRHNPLSLARDWLTNYLGCKRIMKVNLLPDDSPPVVTGRPAHRKVYKGKVHNFPNSLRVRVGVIWLEERMPSECRWPEYHKALEFYFASHRSLLGVTTNG